jgi:hypothetical protein
VNTFVHSTATENALQDLFRSLFAQILVRDNQDENTWKRRLKTFEVNGLLSFTQPSLFERPEFQVDNSKLSDPRYRRQVIRKLKAPRPSKHVFVRLNIDRLKLNIAEYVRDISTLLAFKWVNKMLPVSSAYELLLLLKVDLATLTRALDTMGMHQSSGANVGHLLLRTSVEELVDNNETMKKCLADMKEKTGAIRREFESNIRTLFEPFLAQARASCDAAADHARKQCDEWIEEHRKAAAERKAETDAVLAANKADEDPEASFRAAVLEHERRHREANRWSPRNRWLMRGFVVVVVATLAYFLEINGVTPVEYFTDLFGLSN